MKPKVSIIIANRNDVSMLSVTIRSCIEELRPLGPGQGEIIIVDNSDPQISRLVTVAIPSRYIKEGTIVLLHQSFPCLFTAREQAIKAAKGDYIVCLDSHMVLGHNMIFDLVRFISKRSDDPTMGFAHAPILWAHQHELNAKHDRDMSKSELGDWGSLYKDERPITWKGMPWICRREWFLDKLNGLGSYGALSQQTLSWGGGDMHIGLKPWLLGFKNWAVPTTPAIHIGPFPSIDGTRPNIVNVATSNSHYQYRLWSKSGQGPAAIGFLVSCFVLGGEPMMKRNESAIKERFGTFIDTRKWWLTAMKFGKDEKAWLDGRKKLTMEQLLEQKPWSLR